MRILLVEDDSSLSRIIANALSKYHYECRTAVDYADIQAEVKDFDPHLVLMDINLPQYDGFYLCGEIRKISRVPVIFISARDSSMDVVMAIAQGGDDYVTKPFAMDVLMAKITALLRRTYDYETTPSAVPLGDGFALDMTMHTLRTPDGDTALTRNEFLILQCLAAHLGQAVPRETIMHMLWEDERFIDDNTLTVNINRLRKKLADAGLCDVIATQKGFGYVLRTPS